MNPHHFADIFPSGPETGMPLLPLNIGEAPQLADGSDWNLALGPTPSVPSVAPPPTPTQFVTMEPPTSFPFTPINRPEMEPLPRPSSLTVTPSSVLYDGSR